MNMLLLICFIPVIIAVFFAIRYFWSKKKGLEDISKDINEFLIDEDKPDKQTSIENFLTDFKYAYSLIFKEKEIIFFSLMQWVAIGAAYYLWTLVLGWIPEDVWKAVADKREYDKIYNILFVIWSFLCVGFAAAFIGVFSACIGAVNFLARQNRESTIPVCLKIVLNNIINIWLFHWIDGWITVRTILERLPSKRKSHIPMIVREALYYAWKLGTIGMLPGLIIGYSLPRAARNSIGFVKQKLARTAGLRVGYSTLCWIIGILAYVVAFFFMAYFGPKGEVNTIIQVFYIYAGVPILAATGIVVLFLRPVYIIVSCNIYSDYLEENRRKITLNENPVRLHLLVIFVVLFAAAMATVSYLANL